MAFIQENLKSQIELVKEELEIIQAIVLDLYTRPFKEYSDNLKIAALKRIEAKLWVELSRLQQKLERYEAAIRLSRAFGKPK